MSREETKYPDPDRFMPERFLDSSGKLDVSVEDPEDFVFGFGRRLVIMHSTTFMEADPPPL